MNYWVIAEAISAESVTKLAAKGLKFSHQCMPDFVKNELECDYINRAKVHYPYVCDISIDRVKFGMSLLPFIIVEVKCLTILSYTSLVIDDA